MNKGTLWEWKMYITGTERRNDSICYNYFTGSDSSSTEINPPTSTANPDDTDNGCNDITFEGNGGIL